MPGSSYILKASNTARKKKKRTWKQVILIIEIYLLFSAYCWLKIGLKKHDQWNTQGRFLK